MELQRKDLFGWLIGGVVFACVMLYPMSGSAHIHGDYHNNGGGYVYISSGPLYPNYGSAQVYSPDYRYGDYWDDNYDRQYYPDYPGYYYGSGYYWGGGHGGHGGGHHHH